MPISVFQNVVGISPSTGVLFVFLLLFSAGLNRILIRWKYSEAVFAAARTLKERFRNLLGGPKKTGAAAGIAVILCAGLAGGLAGCSEPGPQLDLDDLEQLDRDYLASPFIAGMIRGWDSPEELAPEHFVYYYFDHAYHQGEDFEQYRDEDLVVYIPAENLEPVVQSHFDVSTEHLRSASYYIPDKNAYSFEGLGGAASAFVTGARQKGSRLELAFEVIDGLGNPLSSGVLHLKFQGEGCKYTSCESLTAASRLLTFPAGRYVVVTDTTLTMLAEGVVGAGPSRDNLTEYDGSDIDSIIRYYMDEALPQLEIGPQAAGTDGAPDFWAWEGTYRNGKPLSIEVVPYDKNSHIITAVFGEGRARSISPFGPILDAGLVNLYDLDVVTRAYVWPLVHAGMVPGYSWDRPSEIRADDLIDLCAYNNLLDLPVNPAGGTIFDGAEYVRQEAPAADVEAALQKHFDVTGDYLKTSSRYNPAAGTYTMHHGWGWGSWTYTAAAVRREGDRLIIDVAVSDSKRDQLIPRGVLTVEIRDGDAQYVSNAAAPAEKDLHGDSISWDNPLLFELEQVLSIDVDFSYPLVPAYSLTDPEEIAQVLSYLQGFHLFETELDPGDFADTCTLNFSLADSSERQLVFLDGRLALFGDQVWEIPQVEYGRFESLNGDLLLDRCAQDGWIYSMTGSVQSVTALPSGQVVRCERRDSSQVYTVTVEGAPVIDTTGGGRRILQEGDSINVRHRDHDGTDLTAIAVFILGTN